MFNYVYLDKKKNLIDIRLSASINPFNFHQHMENLGLINIATIVAWELGIKFIKVNDVVGEIKFEYNYNNYNITKKEQELDPDDNFVELLDGSIRLKYNEFDFEFSSGFLNWKQENFQLHKAKIRSDVIISNGTILKPKVHNDVLTSLAGNKNNFMVLANESSTYPNSYKLLIPDTKSDRELKYINIIESRKPTHIIKSPCFQTRSYSLFIYSKIGNQYEPTHQIYLSGSPISNQTTNSAMSNSKKKPKISPNLNQSLLSSPNLKFADTEFESILYNCLPTPKYAKKELEHMDEYYVANDSKYRDLKTKAIAIDPPGSRDKDDAISFNIVNTNKGKPLFLEMFVHISDVPPAINNKFNRYHFFYAFHKLETDYIYGARYPMIDPRLSESTNSLSLIGPNKRTFTVKTTYRFKPDFKTVFEVPESVEMYLEKDIKIFATTYESIATGTTDYSVDLPVDNEYVVKNKLKYNNKPVPTLNPIPCQSKKADIDKMFWENAKQIEKPDREYLQTQLDQLTHVYGTLVRSLNVCQEIKSFIQTKQYFNDEYQFNLREEWVHRLIEITALETNKYASLILYDKIKNKKWGVDKSKFIGKLSADEIKNYNNHFNKLERFTESIDEDEGIFRALYFGVKGYNDSPKYVKEKYIQCAPACLLPEIKDLTNVTELNNLYLKFQLDKIQEKPTPLSRLASLASFNQTTENLGIALYSTTARPHFNTRLCYYTYFTSPMRRVVDCFVQNCLLGTENEVKDYMSMFKRHILNRTDINNQCEKYNLYISVCNKIFKGDKSNAEFITHYIKYGTDSFNNLYLPNIDITISVSNKLNAQLQPEGKLKLKFKQITEPFEIEVIKVDKAITLNEIIEEQTKLYFQKEPAPKPGTHNYLYLNYRLGVEQ